jgi:hypothetical protein
LSSLLAAAFSLPHPSFSLSSEMFTIPAAPSFFDSSAPSYSFFSKKELNEEDDEDNNEISKEKDSFDIWGLSVPTPVSVDTDYTIRKAKLFVTGKYSTVPPPPSLLSSQNSSTTSSSKINLPIEVSDALKRIQNEIDSRQQHLVVLNQEKVKEKSHISDNSHHDHHHSHHHHRHHRHPHGSNRKEENPDVDIGCSDSSISSEEYFSDEKGLKKKKF